MGQRESSSFLPRGPGVEEPGDLALNFCMVLPTQAKAGNCLASNAAQSMDVPHSGEDVEVSAPGVHHCDYLSASNVVTARTLRLLRLSCHMLATGSNARLLIDASEESLVALDAHWETARVYGPHGLRTRTNTEQKKS